jgi:hypothetical protein
MRGNRSTPEAWRANNMKQLPRKRQAALRATIAGVAAVVDAVARSDAEIVPNEARFEAKVVLEKLGRAELKRASHTPANPGLASLGLKCRIRLPANFRSANLVTDLAAKAGAIALTVANVRGRDEERLSRDSRGLLLEPVAAETMITDLLLDINQ